MASSPDSPRALKKFQEQFQLPFTLLSDSDKTLAQAY
ncbi:MAG: redoxin domain-containing protein [Terriglobales bacterium]